MSLVRRRHLLGFDTNTLNTSPFMATFMTQGAFIDPYLRQAAIKGRQPKA